MGPYTAAMNWLSEFNVTLRSSGSIEPWIPSPCSWRPRRKGTSRRVAHRPARLEKAGGFPKGARRQSQ